MDKSYMADERIGPYEILRVQFLIMIKQKARIMRRLKSCKTRKDYLKSIIQLAKTIDANDTYMRGHCDKVMEYSITISRQLGLSKNEIKLMKTAGILHDIGKIGIDLKILRKPGKLTEDDWKKVKMHPEIGARIVSQSGFLNETVPIIRHHHESYSGGGYPEPDRRGIDIPMGSRIISVADAYDAMTSDRPYRKAMSREEALEELNRCSGKQFDPQIVNAFIISG